MFGKPRTVLAGAVLAACFLIFVVRLQAEEPQARPGSLLRISEIRQGTLASEESCTIVYLDGAYHSERISFRRGYDDSVRVTEGRLGEEHHKHLLEILNSQNFAQLQPPKVARRLADENYHGLYISVPRTEGRVQDLSYPTKESRKESEAALRPLLQWWQELRKSPGQSVKNAQKTRCTP